MKEQIVKEVKKIWKEEVQDLERKIENLNDKIELIEPKKNDSNGQENLETKIKGENMLQQQIALEMKELKS